MIMEDHIHSTFICRTSVLQAKGHYCVAVYSQRHHERCVLFIFMVHLYLIIPWEIIIKDILSKPHIVNHNIRDQEREFFFRASDIQITVVDANLNLFILFGNGNDIGHLIRMLLFPDETRVYELLTSDSIASWSREGTIVATVWPVWRPVWCWDDAWQFGDRARACPHNFNQRHLYTLVWVVLGLLS